MHARARAPRFFGLELCGGEFGANSVHTHANIPREILPLACKLARVSGDAIRTAVGNYCLLMNFMELYKRRTGGDLSAHVV